MKGLPPTHVDFSAKTLLQHLDWDVFAKGEIRKGRWGILGDGFSAELSSSGVRLAASPARCLKLEHPIQRIEQKQT